MKIFFNLAIFLFSTVCLGQINESFLVGKWRYVNTTNLHDSIVPSGIKPFSLELLEDKTFKIMGARMTVQGTTVQGTWKLDETTLILDGKTEGKKETKIQKMVISKVSKTSLSFEAVFENPEVKYLNFVKME